MEIARRLEAASADVSYGLRQLKLNPGFAAAAILSLALGIGANTAIFQLLDAIRLRGLPVMDPWQLATISVQATVATSFRPAHIHREKKLSPTRKWRSCGNVNRRFRTYSPSGRRSST